VLTAFATCALAGLMPAAAAAQDCGSPDNAAIHQYCEDVPSAKTGGGRSGADPAGGPRLTATERRRLAAQGNDGRGVLALVEQGEETSRSTEVAPRRSPDADQAKGTTRRDGRAPREARTPGDAPEAAPEPAVERGGVLAAVGTAGAASGGALWWLLGGATLLLLLAAALQRRHD
jgi:hypothetical protein